MKIDVHVEWLVLEGLPFTSDESRGVKETLQVELARLLNEGELCHELARGGAVPRLNAPQVRIMSGDRPTDVGQRIARAVHGTIGAASALTVPGSRRTAEPMRSTEARGGFRRGVER